MRCRSCSTENPPGSIVCATCGTPAPTMDPRPAGADRATDEQTAIRAGAQLPELDVIAGRFEVRSELGRGGSGMVYLAYDRVLGMEVALKLLQPGMTRDPVAVERLKREIIAARRVSHKNVIRINEFGFDDREAFVAMEYLTGGSLSDLLDEGPPPIGRGVEIAIGICDGLAAAHEAGVIHRDMKPENVLFDAAGSPKLVDFGLARLGETSKLTVGFSGTPFYMSPEQGHGAEITPKSDVYSTGVLLFELFTGKVPFHADSLVRIAMLHATEPPPKPSRLRPGIPEPVESAILEALAKEPPARPTAAGLLERFVQIAASLESGGERPRVPRVTTRPGLRDLLTPLPAPAAAPAPPAPAVRAPPRARRRSPALLGALVLVLGVGGLGGTYLTGALGPVASATPAPTPTPVAVFSPERTETPAPETPAPTPSTEPTPRRTAVALRTPARTPPPTPRATARTIVTALPTPVRPPPAATGTLTVFSYPSVQVWVGSRLLASGTPARGLVLPAGKHVVRFVNESLAYASEYSVVIAADKETKLRVDAEKGTIRRE